MFNQIVKGSKIVVKPHTRYQTLSHGAVIEPPIAHEVAGYETTVRAIYQDVYEDEKGRPVYEYEIETATGELVRPEEVELK